MEISRKVRAALHSTKGVDVNRSHSGAAGLGDLPPHVTGDLLEIVVGVGDDSASFLLECEEIANHFFELPRLIALDQSLGASVLGVSVAAEVDSATKLARALHDRQQLIQIVAIDHCIEADAGDSDLAHAWNGAHDFRGQPRDSARAIVPLVEKVERDV